MSPSERNHRYLSLDDIIAGFKVDLRPYFVPMHHDHSKYFIIDNSVWYATGESGSGSKTKPAAINAMMSALDNGEILAICPPQIYEYLQSSSDVDRINKLESRINRMYPLPIHPDASQVVELQRAVMAHRPDWRRKLSPVDYLTIVYAMINNAHILTADYDFQDVRNHIPGYEGLKVTTVRLDGSEQ